MYSLFVKEIKSFLSSLTGYIVMGVFLVLTGLFLWVFPIQENILSRGFSDINGLFSIAPIVFLFLIPAITMRSFAEERKTGTIELLFTYPLSDIQIILAKYFAAVFLMSAEEIMAVSGMVSIMPMLLDIPLIISIAAYADENS